MSVATYFPPGKVYDIGKLLVILYGMVFIIPFYLKYNDSASTSPPADLSLDYWAIFL